MKYATIFSCAMAILTIACSTKKESNLHNVNDILNSENIITESTANMEYEIIPLELNENSMMSGALEIVPTDNYIFIYTSDLKIMQFTSEGDFVRQISMMGRGPREYTFVNNIFINKTQDRIFLNDMGGKMIEYDFDGNFIDSRPHQPGRWTNIIMGRDGLLYEAFRPIRGDEKYSMIVKKMDGEIVDSVKNNLPKFCPKSGVGGYSESKAMFETHNEMIFHQHTTDTVFTYKDGKLAVRHIFDFGRKLDADAYNNFGENLKNMHLLYDYTEDEHFIYPTFITPGYNITPYMINKQDYSIYKLDIDFGDNGKMFIPRWVYDNTLIDYIEQTEDTNICVVKVKMGDLTK